MTHTYTPETMAVVGATKDRLFPHDVHSGDVSQGGPQGNPLMGAAFCLAIHPYLKRLNERLQAVGGTAKADMDDAYAIGTPGEVFEATEEFLGGLRSIGLMANVAKFEVWSPVART